MAENSKQGEIQIHVGPRPESRSAEPAAPFRVLVAADLMGRSPRKPLELRRPRLVDRDNLEDLLERLAPELSLEISSGAPPVQLRFREMDDFHPDPLLDPLEKWLDQHGDALRSVETEAPPKSAEETATQEVAIEDPPSSQTEAPPATEAGLLDQILDASEGGQKSETRKPPPPKPLPNEVMESIVAPHRVAKPDPRETLLQGNREARLGELLRRLLHHPEFQALESVWRGLRWLVRNVETDADFQIHVLDLSREEIDEPETAKALFRPEPGEPHWTAVTALHFFHPTDDDVSILAHLAEEAAAAGTPFITGATDAWVGCGRLADTPDPDDWADFPEPQGWNELRARDDAGYLGLALLRFLLRLPYGAKTDPVDELSDFEEMANPPRHEDHLWGHPGLACAKLLCDAFRRSGWGFRPGEVLDIDGLPVFVYQRDGESVATPTAEFYLTERAATRILKAGFMPLLSFKHQDRIRLARFQSIAAPVVGSVG
ncbi:MAG: type VI secretion system contractile sheath domain-containing protein [Desulfococcaceae bacterium]